MEDVFPFESIAAQSQIGDTEKRPFVFLHGNTQNDTCGTGIMNYFAAKGHSVYSYDLPGHGDSEFTTENYQFSDLIELNYQFLERNNIKQPILCGHSLGAMIQAGTVAKYQLNDVSLILCGGYDGDPSSSAQRQGQTDQAEIIDRSLSIYISEGFKLFKRQKKYDYFANRELEDGILQIINLRYTQPMASKINLETLTGFSAREALSKMSIPMLVLHGVEEDVIPQAIVEEMLKAYSNIRAEWYPNAGHCAFYQEPELTNQFLDKHYQFVVG